MPTDSICSANRMRCSPTARTTERPSRDTFRGFPGMLPQGMIERFVTVTAMFPTDLQAGWQAFRTSVEFATGVMLLMAGLGIVTVVTGVMCRGLRMLTRRIVRDDARIVIHLPRDLRQTTR